LFPGKEWGRREQRRGLAAPAGPPGLRIKDLDFKFTFLKLSACLGKVKNLGFSD
jgi:hypothetical protein